MSRMFSSVLVVPSMVPLSRTFLLEQPRHGQRWNRYNQTPAAKDQD